MGHEVHDGTAIEWLLASDEPAIRMMARRDLLDLPVSDEEQTATLQGPKVRRLLSGQRADGGFGGHPYKKWTGAHWRLVSLVELGIPAGEPNALAAAETVLTWLCSPQHIAAVKQIDGLTRRCASQEGNALAVASRLGLAGDRRVELLARSLMEWQWPDGGWNCDLRASGRRSSFHESLAPAWGLHEFAEATGDEGAADAARRAAELFLDHHLFRTTRTREPIHKSWLALHYPAYWHYDILQGLVVLARLSLASDERANDALDVLESRRLPDGRWRPGGYWWRPPGTADGNVEVVDWGRGRPSEMITLNCLRVLKAAGRSSKLPRAMVEPGGRRALG
ncbi:MAG TPA: hypothetical protein VHV50_14040 [Actinomycetota bacterium]|jgi:hypothetical protein|nr:hypothetical protein [Actinomycetota bacterium]